MHTADTALELRPPPPAPAPDASSARPAGEAAAGAISQAGQDAGRWCIAWAALATVTTLAAMQFSSLHGRLVYRPYYDDVNYMNDGLEKLAAFYKGGVRQLLRAVYDVPPHSFFSTTMAAGAFAVLGRHDWAPYAANGLVVFALLAFVHWLLGPSVKPWQRWAGYLLVLATRFPATAVVEFRPDLPWGLATAAAILLALLAPLVSSTPRRKALVGACFGAALLIKPSISPVTAVLFGLTMLLAAWCDVGRDMKRLPSVLAAWGTCALAAALVAGPYYAIAWRETYQYIYDNVFGANKELWWYPGTRLQQARYYIDGDGGVFTLGSHVYLLAAVALLGAATAAFQPRHRRRLFAVALATLAAYLLPTVNKVKNPYFGAAFQCLLLFEAVLAMRVLAGSSARTGRRWPAVVIFAAAAASVVMLRGPVWQWNRDGPAVEAHVKLLDQVYSAIHSRAPRGPGTVLLTTEGFCLNGGTLRYLFNLDGSRLECQVPGVAESTEGLDWRLDHFDFVVAGETGNFEALDFLPQSKAQDQTLSHIRAHGGLAEVARFLTRDGRHYHLFAHNDRPFDGWAQTAGLAPQEGPYPQWRMPVIRYGLGPSTILLTPDDSAGKQSLDMACCTHVKDQSMTVLLDGKEIARHIFPPTPAGDQWEQLRDPLDLSPGTHEIEIRYGRWEPGGTPYAVLFSKLRIVR